MKRTNSPALQLVLCMAVACAAVTIVAQQPNEKPAPEGKKAAASSKLEELAVAQGKVADKYARLEQLLIRMAELEATENPQRAALLKRAAQQSSDRLTRQQLNSLIRLLTPPAQLKRAIDDQQQVVIDLKALLELLQSENRSDRLKNEQNRIRDYIKEVDRLIRLQKGVQGRSQGAEEAQKLAGDQQQVAERTSELARRILENEEGGKSKSGDSAESKDGSQNPNAESNGESDASKKEGSSNSKGKDGPDGSKKEGDDKSPDGKQNPSSEPKDDKGDDKNQKSRPDGSKEGNEKPGEAPSEKDGAKDSDASKSSKEGSDAKNESGESQAKSKDGQASKSAKSKGSKSGEPREGEPSESGESQQSEQQQEQQPENPARKRLEAAEQRMRAAQRKLEEANRKDATEEQEKAREELEKAKAELEQILRQMREEEMERTLAVLEGRFRQMLDGQMKVYESTKRMDKIPAAERTRELDIQASKLSFDESKLAVEADKALLLLREEGSSVAFPETVEMIRDDMQTVAERLSNAKVDQLTQGIEEEIIQSLEELIAALQKAQQDLKDKKPPPPQPGQPSDPSNRPLVDKLAELRMIRSLQLRVNTRTQRFARLLDDVEDPVGRANDAELRQSLGKLSEMEKRVSEITRNIVLGKNQ